MIVKCPWCVHDELKLCFNEREIRIGFLVGHRCSSSPCPGKPQAGNIHRDTEKITWVVNAMKNGNEKGFWSNEVAKLLDISTSTLRKWSIALEAEGYIFIRDENDRRAYLERDIMPLQKMKEFLGSGMSMEDATKAVSSKYNDLDLPSRTLPVLEEKEDFMRSERYLELISEIRDIRQDNKALMSVIEQMREVSTALQNMPSVTEMRQAKVTDMITERRIENQLKQEARQLWNAKTDSERLKKVGLFRKEEDTSKRNQFIEEYVEQHFETRIKEAYGFH
jgi:DNA-binding transcriptional MerR regulator